MRLIALGLALLATSAFAFPLDSACDLPIAKGGSGVCGPSYCSNVQNTLPTCAFTQGAAADWPGQLNGVGYKTCSQSTDCRCTSASLKATVLMNSGLVAAWCNDQYLVLASNLMPSWSPYLTDVRNPPGGNVNGVQCATRSTTTGGLAIRRVPLNPVALSTSASSNNVAFFTSAGSSSWIKNIITDEKFGLPVDGSIGFSVGGQEIYPVHNNRGLYTPEACEVDACQEHVGQGGGQPHLHGDPFGSACLYSSAHYQNTAGAQDLTVHPPQIGWSWDGYSIYGRYLSASAPGYSVALDDCGGHTHDSMAYHYHSQVVTGTIDSGCTPSTQCASSVNTTYPVYPPGVFKCWKGDISQMSDFFTYNQPGAVSATVKPCAGSTQYYVRSGYTIPGVGTQDTTAAMCSTTNSSSINKIYNAPLNTTTTTGTTRSNGASVAGHVLAMLSIACSALVIAF